MARKFSEAIVGYVKKHSTMPSRTLARLICRESGKPYSDSVRCAVRYYRGTLKPVHRAMATVKDHFASEYVSPPETDAREWLPHIVEGCESALIIADVHVPYHDRHAVEKVVKLAQDRRVKSVILAGDICDFYMLSRFEKNPLARSVPSEIEALNEFMDYLEDKLFDPQIIYKLGNHDERLDRYICARCPELYGMDGLNLASQIRASERGLVLVADQRLIHYGRLRILHGHECGSATSPVNPARGLYIKTKSTALCAHHHQSSQHSETDLEGRQTACWSIGCLCELHPSYARINRWNHGVAIARKDKSGNFELENFRLVNGEVRPS